MKWLGPWLHAKGADKKVLYLHRCQKRFNCSKAAWGHEFKSQSREPNCLLILSLISTWHPCTVPAHQSVQINTASLHTLQQDDANLGWESVICRIPESTNLSSKGCYSGHATLFTSKTPVFIRSVLSRLYMKPDSLRVHWMPLSVLQAQQDTAGRILSIYI